MPLVRCASVCLGVLSGCMSGELLLQSLHSCHVLLLPAECEGSEHPQQAHLSGRQTGGRDTTGWRGGKEAESGNRMVLEHGHPHTHTHTHTHCDTHACF